MEFLQIAAGIIVVGLMGVLSAAALYWFNRRLGVNVAQDNYTEALEGELGIVKDRYTRLETESKELRVQLTEVLARAVQLETDVMEAKAENDRLRAENVRLRLKLEERNGSK